MSENEKVPAGGGTPTGTRQEKRQGVAAIPCSYSTTGSLERQPLRVSDLLGAGEENAQTMKQIRQIYHGDSRSIRQAIQRERLSGIAVLSGAHGYWLAGDEGEVELFCASMGSRRREIGKVIAAVRAAYGLTARSSPQLEGQIGFLEGVGGDGTAQNVQP